MSLSRWLSPKDYISKQLIMRTFCIFIIQKGCSWIKKIYLKNFNWMLKLNSSFTDWQVCKEIAEKKYRRQFYNDITLWLFTQKKISFTNSVAIDSKRAEPYTKNMCSSNMQNLVHQTMKVIDHIQNLWRHQVRIMPRCPTYDTETALVPSGI